MNQFKKPVVFVVSILFLIMDICPAFAELTIVITKSSDQALPIAIVPFEWTEKNSAAPISFSGIIGNDLERTGQFKAIPEADMLEKPHDSKQVRYFNWRSISVENLVVGKFKALGSGKYAIEFQLLDTIRGRQIIGYSIPANENNLRNVAHHISDLIYEAITGEKGAFNTQIAYITASKFKTAESKKPQMLYTLEVADTDGYNAKIILKSRKPIMSPSWSPDGKQLAYVSFEQGRPEIYVQSAYEGARARVASFEGINGAPVWSPDGRQLALTLSHKGNPDIYTLDLASKQLKQITQHWSIDTEPAWMPNSKSLVFTSDRSGTPQLYEVTLTDDRPKRLSFEGSYNVGADISPDGQTVAMVHLQNGRYQIATLDRRTGLFRILTDGRLDESPSFAPNGSMLLYASESKGRGVLAAVSVDGRMQQQLVLKEGDIREPTWGPFVK